MNAWIGAHATRTNAHFDSHDNLLVVLAGRKTVTLWPPSAHAAVASHPVWSEASSHARAAGDAAHPSAVRARVQPRGAHAARARAPRCRA